MTVNGKEHYELMKAFGRDFRDCRLDREDKDLWTGGWIYQSGDVNKLFLAYRKGYALGKLCGS